MNEIQVLPKETTIAVQFPQEKIELIKNTIAQDATDLELQLFIEQCKRTGLDPITRQIYFIKDKKNNKVQVQTSIDGFRLIAERSGAYEGQTSPMWCGADGVWKDVWLAKVPPAACKVGVYKKGFREALYAVAVFDEYAQRKYTGELSHMWAKMPALMISKVAESLALRKAFANDLSGLYTQEEMGQAENEEEKQKPAKQIKTVNAVSVVERSPSHSSPPIQQDSSRSEGVGVSVVVTPSLWEETPPAHFYEQQGGHEPQESAENYIVPIGKKYKGKKLSEIPLDELASFVLWLQNQSAEQNKPLQGDSLIFTQKAEEYIKIVRSR